MGETEEGREKSKEEREGGRMIMRKGGGGREKQRDREEEREGEFSSGYRFMTLAQKRSYKRHKIPLG